MNPPVVASGSGNQEMNVINPQVNDNNVDRNDSNGLIRTNNAYLPDIVVEGSCSTLKLTLDNVNHNIQSIITNYKYLEQIMPIISTPDDGILFRNNVHKILRSTKTVIEDTKGILQQVNLIFDRQDDDQKLKIFEAQNDFRDAVVQFNTTQKQFIVKFRIFCQPERSHANRYTKPAILEYMRTPYGSLQTLYFYQQQKTYRNPEVEYQKLLDRENALCQTESGIYDVNDILVDLTMMINAQRPAIEAIERAMAEAARRQAEAAERAQRNARRRKKLREILLTVLSISVTIMLSGCILVLVLY